MYGFRLGPGQVAIPFSGVPRARPLFCAEASRLDQSTVRGGAPHLVESRDLADLAHHGQREEPPDAQVTQQRAKLVTEPRVTNHFHLDDQVLFIECVRRLQQAADTQR